MLFPAFGGIRRKDRKNNSAVRKTNRILRGNLRIVFALAVKVIARMTCGKP